MTQRLLGLLDMLSSIENEREQEQEQEQQQAKREQDLEQDPYREGSGRRSHVPRLDGSAGRLLMVEVAATIKFFILKFAFVRAAFCFHTTSLSCNYGMGSDVRDGVRTTRGSSTSSENDSRMSPRSLLLHALYTSAPAPSASASPGDPSSAPRSGSGSISRSGSGSGSGSVSRKFGRVSHTSLLSLSLSTFIPSYWPFITYPLNSRFFLLLHSFFLPSFFFFFLTTFFLSLRIVSGP